MKKSEALQEKTVILRRREVQARTGLSRASIYLAMKEGRFPRPIKLGLRAVGWVESEIEEWLAIRLEVRNNS